MLAKKDDKWLFLHHMFSQANIIRRILSSYSFHNVPQLRGGISYDKDGGTRRKFLKEPLRDTKITSQLTRRWSPFSWQTTEPFSSHLMIKK